MRPRTGGGRQRKRGNKGYYRTGLTYDGTLAPVMYATLLSVLDRVDEEVSLPVLRTDC